MAAADEDDVLHRILSQWITQNGGNVHPNLALHTPDLNSTTTDNGDENSHRSSNGFKSCHDDDNDTTSSTSNNDTTTTTHSRSQQPEKQRPVNNRFTQRGIFAKHGPISKGEILIRLPPHLALDGSQLPKSYRVPNIKNISPQNDDGGGGGTENNNEQQQRNASPWLRCLASLIQAWYQSKYKNQCCNANDGITTNPNDGIPTTSTSSSQSKKPTTTPITNNNNKVYNPYLASLPEEYDSLLNWSHTEIQCFLAGTALGKAAVASSSQDDAACGNTSNTLPNSNAVGVDGDVGDDDRDDHGGGDGDSGGGGDISAIKNTITKEDQHERALHERFLQTVVPYLTFLKSNGLFLGDGDKNNERNGDDDADNDDNDAATTTMATTMGKSNSRGNVEEGNCDAQRSKRQKLDTTTSSISHSNNEDDENVKFSHEAQSMYPLFREGCMCISTRAFHMQSPPSATTTNDNNDDDDDKTNANSNECYQGPYLLPYIDLLNHSPRGSEKHVTTLRRDYGGDGSFLMVAERDIAMEEEVCHSYDSGSSPTAAAAAATAEDAMSTAACREEDTKEESSSLNSAQLLQTFGFVDVKEAGKRILGYYQRNDGAIGNSNEGRHHFANLGNNITPAILTKEEISHACKRLASSSYPDALRKFMDQSGMVDDGWEHWEISKLDEETGSRWESLKPFSEELVIPFGGSLSDELITVCCMHFLPDDVIGELLEESTTEVVLLGKEVLEDYFLGKLVLRAIVDALKEKLNTYRVYSAHLPTDVKRPEQTREFLEFLGGFYLSECESHKSESFSWGDKEVTDANVMSNIMTCHAGGFADILQKFKYGMLISLEERACLLELRKKALGLLVLIDGEDS